MFHKWMVYTIVLFFMFFNIVHIARAEEEPFGISLDCLDSCKDKSIDSSKDIMLVLTIKNNLNFWVSIGEENNINTQSVFKMNLENNNLKDDFGSLTGKKSESHNDLLGKRILIKPKTELPIYIPFDTYNKLSTDNRLGDWKIHPELQVQVNNVEFYNNPFDSKPMFTLYYSDGQPFTIKPSLIGNILEFKVVKQETKVQVEKSNVIVPEGLLESLYRDYIKVIIAGVAVSVIAYVITNRLPKKAKSKKK